MWAYPRGQGLKNDTAPGTIAYAARQALELGADMVKIKSPGSRDAMEWTTTVAGEMPVVMSGGSKTDDLSFLQSVETAMDGGAAGLAVGRNVFQREEPTRILDALEAVIFGGESAEQALDAAGGSAEPTEASTD
jgi:class I fructose-bisphosphate aldolase